VAVLVFVIEFRKIDDVVIAEILGMSGRQGGSVLLGSTLGSWAL
jgi:hypothetical protein